MKHTNKFILFLAIDLIIILITAIVFGADIINVLSSNGLWIMPLPFVLFGVLIGYLISLALKKDKEDKAFFWGQLLSCILLFVFSIVRGYDGWKYRNYQSNIESNWDVMRYNVSDNEQYVRTAFRKLESNFPNHNEFSLQSFHVEKQDTIINSIQDTLYAVYFTCFLNRSKNKERLSKLTVFQNKADLNFIHELADTNKEYQTLRTAFRKEHKTQIEEAERIINQMQKKGDQPVIDSLTQISR